VRLVYRPLYLDDVAECAGYLASEAGEKVANQWYESLKKALAHIQENPEIGRIRHDLPVDGIRTLNLRKYPNYLIFYRGEKSSIELLRIRHGMMNLTDLFTTGD
jgi:plasmid stabilization system protein ParE